MTFIDCIYGVVGVPMVNTRSRTVMPTIITAKHHRAILFSDDSFLRIVRELANETKWAAVLANSRLICAETGRKPPTTPRTYPTANPPSTKRSFLSRAALYNQKRIHVPKHQKQMLPAIHAAFRTGKNGDRFKEPAVLRCSRHSRPERRN